MSITTHDTIHGAGLSLARQVAESDRGSVALEPGDATRYEVVAVHDGYGPTLVALPNFGRCYRTGLGWTHPSYVAEKFDVPDGSAEVIADLLAVVGEELDRIGWLASTSGPIEVP